jgi:hypothetical protein
MMNGRLAFYLLSLFLLSLVPPILVYGSASLFRQQRCLSSVLLLVGSCLLLFCLVTFFVGQTWARWWLEATFGGWFYSDVLLCSGIAGGVVFSIGFLEHAFAQRRHPQVRS